MLPLSKEATMTRRFVLILSLVAATALAADGQKKILITNEDPGMVQELQNVTPKAKIVAVTQQNVMQEIADADGFIGNITPAQVRAGKNLKWVQIMSAGAERVLHLAGGSDLRDSQIILTNNQIVQGPEIADHAFAMLLTLSRGIHTFLENKRQELWQARPYP